MGSKLKHYLKILLSLFAFFYFLIFLAGSFFYIFSLSNLWKFDSAPFYQYFWWLVMGISLSLLSCLCAWPLSLAIAILVEQFKRKKGVVRILRFLKFFESLPLIVFVFLYIEVVGFYSFGWFEKFWSELFTTSHFLTKGIAFGLTILLYPLTILPIFNENLTVDLFYKKILGIVSEFAEIGLVTSVIVFGLTIYILPKMILRMNLYLSTKGNTRSHEVIQSIGGTPWESVYMTVVQSMKEHFNLIILRFTRICFFEAIITYTLLNSFFTNTSSGQFHWGTTLSSMFIAESLDPNPSLTSLSIVGALLAVCYIIFVWLERFFINKMKSRYV